MVIASVSCSQVPLESGLPFWHIVGAPINMEQAALNSIYAVNDTNTANLDNPPPLVPRQFWAD